MPPKLESKGAEPPEAGKLEALIENQQLMLKMLLEKDEKREAEARQREIEARNREETLLKRLQELSVAPHRSSLENGLSLETDSATIVAAMGARIPLFEYEEESGSTFEKWVQRFEDSVLLEGAKITDADQRSLLISKLNTQTYSMFTDHILPRTPAQLDYVEAKEILTDLFGEKISLFRRRYNAFRVVKANADDFKTYSAKVNQLCERGRLKEMTESDIKCLLFVAGLQESAHRDLRKRLLRLLECGTAKTLKELTHECETSLMFSRDAELQQTEQVMVGKIKQKWQPKEKRKRLNSNKESAKESAKPPNKDKCFKCGNIGHWARNCRVKVKPSSKVNTVVNVCHVSSLRRSIVIQIRNIDVTMQLDTGAEVTIIDAVTWHRLGQPKLERASLELKAANGSSIDTLGVFETEFAVKGLRGQGNCFVTENIMLLGMEWISQIKPFTDCFNAMCLLVEQTNTDLATELKQMYPDVFNENLGRCTKLKAELVVKNGATPVFVPKRKVPFAIEETVNKELDRLVKMGVITPVSYSSWASPIVPVRKKNGEIRICADYSTGLNDALELNRHPLPTPEEIFAKINGGTVFSQVDLKDAYLQIEMSEESKELLTINTSRGLYRYNRLPFGVKSAPGIFQSVMDNLIAGLPGCATYLDDIVVSGTSETDHDENVRALFKRIAEFGIRVRLEKCAFKEKCIKFLGFIVDSQGRRPDPEKTKAIEAMPRPNNLSEVESFLGMVSFYGTFVPKMREYRAPLDALKKKNTKFLWTDECEKAFINLKSTVNSGLLLCHYDPKKPIIVAADASEKGLGAVITHKFPNGSEKAICHVSRALTAAEKNYSQTEKEGLAIIFAVRKFHRYIYGRKFTLLTDHKPLLGIFGRKQGISAHSANRLQRWCLTLMAYDFDIQFRSTTNFGQADALSRLIPKRQSVEEDVVIAAVEADVTTHWETTISSLPVTLADVERATNRDYILNTVADCVKTGDWPECHKGSALYNFRSLASRLSLHKGCLFLGHRIVVPHGIKNQILKMLHRGHPGQTRMKLLARSYVYWIGLDKDINLMVERCNSCQKAAKMPLRTELTPWPETCKPMERVHCDFAGPVNGRMYLVVVDSYSRWPEILQMAQTTTLATIRRLEEIFARFGFPETLVSDNGSQFTSSEFARFCKQNGISHIRSPPYFPQSNGLAERFVDTFKRGMIKNEKAESDISALSEFLMAYRMTPCAAAEGQLSPAELFIGRNLCTPLTELKLKPNPVSKNSKGRKDVMTRNYNRRHGARKKQYSRGDCVFARDYRSQGKVHWLPGKVLNVLGKSIYEVLMAENNVIWKRHCNQLRPRASVIEPIQLPQPEDFDVHTPPLPTNDNSTTVRSPDTSSILPSTLDRPLSSSSREQLNSNQLRRSSRQCSEPRRLQINPKFNSYD